MRKFAKLTSLILVIVMVVSLGLTGCGGNGGSNGGKTVNEKGQVVIRISMQEGSIQDQAVELMESYIKKNSNITFKVEPIVGEYTTKLITQASAGTAPDIVWVSDVNTRTLASKNLLVDLEPYYKANNFDSSDVYESMLECGKYVGKQYMIPRDFNQVVTFYNKALFDEVGVAYPKDNWTWEEFVDTASKFPLLSNSGKVYLRRGCQANLNWGATAPIIFMGLGGTLTDDWANGTKANVDTEGSVKALTEIKRLVDNGTLVNNYKNDIGDFNSGKVAMMFQTRSNVSSSLEELGENLQVTTFPILPAKRMTGSGCSGFAVMSASKCKDEAVAFVLYISSKEGQLAFSTNQDCCPVLKSLANDETWRNTTPTLNNDVFIMNSEYCVLQPTISVGSDDASTTIDSAWKEMFSACLTGVYDVEKSVKYGQQKMEQAFNPANK